jgi:hypothetical protein
MATYHVSSTGSNTSPYDTWAKAATTFATAVTAATASGDLIRVASSHSENLAADASYTLSPGVQVYSVNTGTNAQEAGATIIGNASGVDISIQGGPALVWGMTFKTGASTGLSLVKVGNADSSIMRVVNCTFETRNTATASTITFGHASLNSMTTFESCIFKWGRFSHYVLVSGWSEFIACDFGSASATALTGGVLEGSRYVLVKDCDFSYLGSNPLMRGSSTAMTHWEFRNCKLGTTLWASSMAFAVADVTMYDCAAGDQHYHIYHENYLGKTEVASGIYADGNISNNVSWKITTTANLVGGVAYMSPEISQYRAASGTAFTPSLEVLRDGSATAFTAADMQVAFRVKATSGSVVRTRYMSDGSFSTGVDTWTGDNATHWYGKLPSSSSITQAENGYVSAQLNVYTPSITVYVDPQIRGL